MRISDWSSDVCSSDLRFLRRLRRDCGREAINYVLETGAGSEGQMHACGVVVINPPFSFVGEMAAALPWLADMLSQGAKAAARAEHWMPGTACTEKWKTGTPPSTPASPCARSAPAPRTPSPAAHAAPPRSSLRSPLPAAPPPPATPPP